MKKLIAITMLVTLFGLGLNAQDKATMKEIKGTWLYTADAAPYDYREGKVIFYEEEGEFKAKLDIQGYVIKTKDLKVEKNKVSFGAYVEYELITVKLELEDGKLEGTAFTSEGDLSVSLEKE